MNGWWIVSLLLLLVLGAIGWLIIRCERLLDEVRAQHQKPARGPAR